MAKRKLLPVIALLLAFSVILVGCGSSKKKSEIPAVEASINGFADAYNRGNYQTCADYLVGITDANRDTIVSQLSTFHQMCTTIQVDSIDSVTINESTATASVTLTALSKQVTIDMSLTKAEDGTWKFSFGDMVTAISKQFGF